MEQKDYILREIEKISKILQAIGQKLFGGNNSNKSDLDNENVLTNMLLDQLNFDINKLDSLDNTEFEKYIESIKGFNYDNIEYFADLLFQIGLSSGFHKSQEYFTRSLRLYEYVNKQTKTFSFDRESAISEIKGLLKSS